MNVDAYSETFTVKAHECDAAGRMTPGAILRRVQQIGADQCSALGLTEQVHAASHTAFLLAKIAMEQRAPICAGQRMTITTKPAGAQRAVYSRCTTICTPDGAERCALDSRWVLVDTQTRRILRRPPETLPIPFAAPPAFALDFTLPRADVQPDGEETAFYTRCDSNGHLNNTRYADIVCDHMPLEQMLSRAPVRMVLVYHSEVPMGRTFTLLRGQADADTWYFLGEGAGGLRHFEAALTLGDAVGR